MKTCYKFVLLVAFLGIVQSPAPSLSQEVVDFFTAPGDGASTGLTTDGASLFSASVAAEGSTIYELETDGDIISSFQFDGLASGLAFNGQYLWVSKFASGTLHELTMSGDEVGTLSTSLGSLAGLTWDGSNLWAIDNVNSTINRLAGDGQVLNSFTFPVAEDLPTGLAWNNGSLWVCGSLLNLIYQLSTGGSILMSFPGPGLNATDLEWDSEFLWVSDIVTDRIYKLRVTPADQIIDARVEFPGGHWPEAWGRADQKPSCDTTVDIDQEDLVNWHNLTSDEFKEKMACRRKVNCYIGDLRLDDQTFELSDILIETIRLNDSIPVMFTKNCPKDYASSAAATNNSGWQSCYEAKIYNHLDRFNGRVLRVRFDATKVFKILGKVNAQDTVEICVSGYLTNGMKFEGCTFIVIVGDNPLDLDPESPLLPRKFALLGNYPNPFNASTTVRFELSRAGMVELEVYNILGQKVKTLIKQQMTAGTKQVVWDGRDERGVSLPTGIYFYRLITLEGRETGKMTMLK